MKTIDKFEVIMIAVFIGLCVFFLYHINRRNVKVDDIQKTDTIYETKTDTIHLTHTITKYKPQPTRTDTIYKIENNEVQEHIQKTYESDGSYKDTSSVAPATVDYHLYVRTDNNDVDSIGLKFNVDYPMVTETKTITNTIVRKKHFNYGIQTGVGYGLFNRKPDVYVGFGVQYNF